MALNAPLNLGFLTILHQANGFLGGYLVTNQWGRPLEFRLSTAVQPNRVQQILYGGTLTPYICSDLIGKTLVEKTGLPVQMVVTDIPAALDLRLKLEAPVLLLNLPDSGENGEGGSEYSATTAPGPTISIRENMFGHGQFPEDGQIISDYLDRLTGFMDVAEPFQRIREAMGEARKMGVGSRV